jgi:hypothetical protein
VFKSGNSFYSDRYRFINYLAISIYTDSFIGIYPYDFCGKEIGYHNGTNPLKNPLYHPYKIYLESPYYLLYDTSILSLLYTLLVLYRLIIIQRCYSFSFRFLIINTIHIKMAIGIIYYTIVWFIPLFLLYV